MITFPGNESDFNGNNQDYISQDLNDRNHVEDKIKKDMNQVSLQPFIGMKFQSLEEVLGVFYPCTKSNPNASRLVELIAIEGLI
ncbi:hypothetical protein E1A91_D07G040900v1 [Gossypium mustelinum]|uniref:Uncharacterized protein n=1 Tax=Gossypium mustelinum TaxID=34275 RepID=A0A5D2U5Q4_GOSMU|nr:hypothetical protein E1A91_D07G040900v1 [Gossypium mustelinum]